MATLGWFAYKNKANAEGLRSNDVTRNDVLRNSGLRNSFKCELIRPDIFKMFKVTCFFILQTIMRVAQVRVQSQSFTSGNKTALSRPSNFPNTTILTQVSIVSIQVLTVSLNLSKIQQHD